ncbi:TonB-dependent siderophore receptor [Rhodoplanes sp. TEM]|uniref:TonB-dependent siderophore receptor n=1 Tax=Rhodoplanes tepidamans TaxID=200616 RepID=A0ABT5JEQ8_RHOTP|nr:MULTISPECIES: TonB-dependent siderophore receptor [Rhodoplanes]MDC7788111.1 TonB-dependent siderophore receptor [Rhodoplanes tepidamans]MDC7984593.1 TonB-dependent siderophore receptor [Rhodoplanes sp. TEM]MDQ0355598.1 iron complex outermembrane receptor protein [Rhodoplanes tepidamans]
MRSYELQVRATPEPTGGPSGLRRVFQGRGLWLAPTILAALHCPDPAVAQSVDVPAASRSRSAGVSFSIPAGPLGPALTQWAEVSGLKVLFSSEVVRGVVTPGVDGSRTPTQALSALLAGTGLSYDFTSASTVAIHRAADGAPAAGEALPGAVPLDPISVVGAGTIGYIATRSDAGTKTETPIVETPRSISVVTRQELEDRNVQSVPEAVRYTAGVTTGAFGYDPRFDQIYIRGFAATTLGDYRDGLQQYAGSYARFTTEPYGLERIDIVKGPASVLYGQGTPGGLIDRISKLPKSEATHEVVGQLGSFGHLQAAFDVGGPIDADKSFLYRIVGVARTGETNYDIADERLYLAPSFTWRNDSTSFTVIALADKSETDANVAMINRSGHVTTLRASDPAYDYQKQTQYQIGYKFEHRFDDVWKVRQNLRYSTLDLEGRYLTGGVTGGGFASSSSTIYRRGTAAVVETLDAFQVDNQVQATFATGPLQHTLLMGLDYGTLTSRFGSGTTAANAAYALNILDPIYGLSGPTAAITTWTGSDFDQLGAYAQDQIKLGNWRLSLSGRQDWTNRTQTNLMTGALTGERDDQAFSYSGGLLYLFDSGFAPYVSYATSFQPTSSLDIDGRVLEPATGKQYEVGVKYQPAGDHLTLTLAGYHLAEQNAAKYAGYNGATGLYYYKAIGEIETRGVELEGRLRLENGLEAIAAYTYSDAEIVASATAAEIGKVPAVTPRHVASLWMNYTVPSGPLYGASGGIGIRYIGETFGNNTNTVTNEGYTVVDATLRYDIGKFDRRFAGLSVSVNATNIADVQPEICNSGTCYLGQGRKVLANVKYRW